MREIKFRARTKEGVWKYGMLTYANFNKGVEKAIAVKTELGSIWLERIDDSTIGQFTGLYDQDNIPIYEGDILEISKRAFEGDTAKIQHGDIYWRKGTFHIREIYSSDGYDEIGNVLDELCDPNGMYHPWVVCNVTGNIYDNSELIKE